MSEKQGGLLKKIQEEQNISIVIQQKWNHIKEFFYWIQVSLCFDFGVSRNDMIWKVDRVSAQNNYLHIKVVKRKTKTYRAKNVKQGEHMKATTVGSIIGNGLLEYMSMKRIFVRRSYPVAGVIAPNQYFLIWVILSRKQNRRQWVHFKNEP